MVFKKKKDKVKLQEEAETLSPSTEEQPQLQLVSFDHLCWEELKTLNNQITELLKAIKEE